MKKLLLSLLFALVALTGLHAQTIWNGTADTEWYDETSAEFEISTAEQLAGLAKLVNNGNDFSYKTVRLTADIVLNDTSDWENWENSAPANTWTPIGIWDSFSGTFDGQGYTVSGVYINTENPNQGLFRSNSGTIKNVGVTESYIKGDYYVGGVCGSNSHGTISNCHNTGTVNGGDYVGGVCGFNYCSTISYCYNSGIVSGTGEESTSVGGVCGFNSYGTISNCYNTGTVSGNNDNVGGVCGSNNGTISNCYNIGIVKERNDSEGIGSVCGYNYGSISNCYYLEGTATGGINGNDVSGQAEVRTAEQFASGEVCWLLNEEQSEGTWGQKLGTDPCPVLGGPAVFKDGETYYNEEGSAIVETNSEQASFVIVSENLTINIYGSDGEATVYNLAGIVVYHGSERIIPVQNPGIYMVRIGNEVQKTIVR